MTTTPGVEFARAFAAKDYDRVVELLDPEIDFRGMTPNRIWEAHSPGEIVSDVLKQWMEDSDEIESLERVETGSVGDRDRVGYLFRVSNPEGRFLVEQQAYLSAEEGRITWMRVICSGFRPDPEAG